MKTKNITVCDIWIDKRTTKAERRNSLETQGGKNVSVLGSHFEKLKKQIKPKVNRI